MRLYCVTLYRAPAYRARKWWAVRFVVLAESPDAAVEQVRAEEGALWRRSVYSYVDEFENTVVRHGLGFNTDRPSDPELRRAGAAEPPIKRKPA